MFSGRDASSPDSWDTHTVLDWILHNDSSREEMKNRVMGVVRANDLDGHTLMQLAAEKDEIQALFPALKDRLAFKFMLRKLFKEEGPGFQNPSSTDNQSPSSSGQAPPDHVAHPTSLHHVPHPDSVTSLWPSNVHPAPSTHSTTLGNLPAELVYQSWPDAADGNYQPTEKKTRLSFNNSYAMPPSDPALRQKVHNFQPMNTIPSISSDEMQRPASANQQANTSILAFCLTNPTKAGPPFKYPSTNMVFQDLPPQSSSPEPPKDIYYMTIDYPAPLPKFPHDLEEMLRLHTRLGTVITGTGEIPLSSLRKRVNNACARFYFDMTNGQRLTQKDYHNIGRTVLGKYPLLAFDGESPPWMTFNKSLSQAIRNLRRHFKKTNGDSPQTSPEDSLGAVEGPVPVRLISLGQGEDSSGAGLVDKAIKDEGSEDGQA